MRNSNKYVLRGLQNVFNVEVQDNCEMRNNNKYVLRGLQNEINLEVEDNSEMRNSNKYVLRGLLNEFNLEYKIIVRCKTVIHMFYVDFRMRLMWKYKIIVR
jgi:hypothetical protein